MGFCFLCRTSPTRTGRSLLGVSTDDALFAEFLRRAERLVLASESALANLYLLSEEERESFFSEIWLAGRPPVDALRALESITREDLTP
jgi:hypothetical protein